MSDNSPRLGLPYLLPAQAQKHVTHNAALERLDALTQLTLAATGAETPPAEAEEGEVHALGAEPVGDWAGQGGRLAIRAGGGWTFADPVDGWRAWDAGAGVLRLYSGGSWGALPIEADGLDGVGIGTAWDATNRLAVASEAVLLTHAGAGHQVKVNKAADADTASLLFQSGYTGHAEMGLAGDTAFSLKVSADGAAWAEALRADPAGVRIDLPVTGAAVQDGPVDRTAGRLMAVSPAYGSFGLGGLNAPVLADVDSTEIAIGFYRTLTSTTGSFPGGVARYGRLRVERYSPNAQFQELQEIATNMIWRRFYSGGSWSPWRADRESGSNANGGYLRLGSGVQLCWGRVLVKPAADASAGVKSATWTFPAAFAATATLAVSHSVEGTDPGARGGTSLSGVTTTGVTLSYEEGAGLAEDVHVHAVAQGFWI